MTLCPGVDKGPPDQDPVTAITISRHEEDLKLNHGEVQLM